MDEEAVLVCRLKWDRDIDAGHGPSFFSSRSEISGRPSLLNYFGTMLEHNDALGGARTRQEVTLFEHAARDRRVLDLRYWAELAT
jgi:hypothetical protein